jgi:hypothetical protein
LNGEKIVDDVVIDFGGFAAFDVGTTSGDS